MTTTTMDSHGMIERTERNEVWWDKASKMRLSLSQRDDAETSWSVTVYPDMPGLAAGVVSDDATILTAAGSSPSWDQAIVDARNIGARLVGLANEAG